MTSIVWQRECSGDDEEILLNSESLYSGLKIDTGCEINTKTENGKTCIKNTTNICTTKVTTRKPNTSQIDNETNVMGKLVTHAIKKGGSENKPFNSIERKKPVLFHFNSNINSGHKSLGINKNLVDIHGKVKCGPDYKSFGEMKHDNSESDTGHGSFGIIDGKNLVLLHNQIECLKTASPKVKYNSKQCVVEGKVPDTLLKVVPLPTGKSIRSNKIMGGAIKGHTFRGKGKLNRSDPSNDIRPSDYDQTHNHQSVDNSTIRAANVPDLLLSGCRYAVKMNTDVYVVLLFAFFLYCII